MKKQIIKPEKVSWEINGNEFNFHTLENDEGVLDLYVNVSVNTLINVTDYLEIDFKNIQIKFKNIHNMILTKNTIYAGYDDPFFDYKKYDTSDWDLILEMSNLEKGIIWKKNQICPDPRFYSVETNENSKYYKIAADSYELDIICEEYSYDFIID